MTWAAPKAIEGLIEEPILVLVVGGIANWGTHCNPLIIWEDSLAKGILAVSLLEDLPAGASLRGEEAERRVLENRCVLVRFRVDSIFEVSEYDDA